MSKKQEKINKNVSIYTPKTPKNSKRFAAWVVDMILIIVVATGIAFLTSLLYGYDNYNNTCIEKEIEYGLYVEQEKGPISFEGKNYVVITEIEGISEEEVNQRLTNLSKDKEYVIANQKRNLGPVIIVTMGLTGSLLIFELIIPLCLKHGRTIGMRFFDIGYVTDEGIEVGFKQLFIRFLFGKLIVQGLIPFAGLMYIIIPSYFTIVGVVALLGVPILNMVLMYITPEKRGIHDFIAKCVPVDNSCQIYFKTVDELSKAKAEEERNKNERKYY